METAPPTRTTDSPPRLWPQLLPVLWLPPALGLLLFAATRHGGFLSDDFLLKVYVDCRDSGLEVRWSQIWADFTRPWLDLGSSFYRPMLSLSFGIDLERGGMDPAVFHQTNLALHAITTLNTAWLCALCCPRRPRLAALLGGCLFAVHPVACEPIAWIAARNSELEVFFRSFALLAFAYYLTSPSRRRFAITGMFVVCALASKESSIILPVSLLGLDFLLCPHSSLRDRAIRQLRFAPFWIGYFLLRFALFGQFVGSTGSVVSTGDIIDGFTSKAAALFIPNGPSLSLGWGFGALALLYATAVFNGARDRCLRPTLLLGFAWIALHFAPTYQLKVYPDLAGSRMLYGTVTILAIVLARLSLNGSERIARIAFAIAITAVASLAVLNRQQQEHYREVWRELGSARSQLDAIGQALQPGQTLAITSMPKNRFGIPVLNENAFFPTAERPFASADYPVAGLGFVTLPVPKSETLYQDPAAFRALWEEGSPLLLWKPEAEGKFEIRSKPEHRPIPALIQDPDKKTEFKFTKPCSAYWFEAVEIRVEGKPQGGTLWWQTEIAVADELKHIRFGTGLREGNQTVYRVDLSHAYGLLAFTVAGIDIIDFEVRLDGEVKAIAMRPIARVPELDLSTRFGGAVMSLDEFEAAVTVPDGATGLVLIGPHTGFLIAVKTGEPLVIPEDLRMDMETIARISSVNQYRFYFETRSQSSEQLGARSLTDGFRLRR